MWFLFRLPNFSGRYILGLTMTRVEDRPRLYWFVKESSIHLSLYVTELDITATSSIAKQSRQLCYVQAHAASVTFTYTLLSLLFQDSVLKGIALDEKPISELRSVTCHMELHSVICHLGERSNPATQTSTRFAYQGEMEC